MSQALNAALGLASSRLAAARRAGLFLLLLLLPTCRRPTPVTTGIPPATQPAGTAAIGGTYKHDAGIQLNFPAGWVAAESPDYVWMIAPSKSPGKSAVSLEIPKLPFHVPGMIPINSVKNGYLEDLKKGKQSFQSSVTNPSIPGARADLVRSSWTENGTTLFETALLMVHGDHVFILRAEGETKDEPSIMPTFDAVRQSLHWTK